MKVTFLGTGTSQGVPIIGCDCLVCTSNHKKDKRLRVSVLIETHGTNIVIDSGPDFRYQMLREGVKKLDGLLFTHGHKDHIAGMDDIRAFNYISKKKIDVFATDETQAALRREYQYIFESPDYPGVPQINLHTIHHPDPIYVNGVKIIPIKVMHYQIEVIGFRIGDFTYITDANYISPEELEKVKHSKVLVLNALRHEKHVSHYNLEEALEVGNEAKCGLVYFTHISHQLGLHKDVESTLPPGFHLAFDGLTLEM